MSARKPLHGDRSVTPTTRINATNRSGNNDHETMGSSDEDESHGQSQETQNNTTETDEQNITADESYRERSEASHSPSPPSPKRQQPPEHKQSYKAKSYEQQQQQQSSNKKAGVNLSLVVFIIVLGIVAYNIYGRFESKPKQCSFEQLRQRKPLQPAQVWHALSVGIELLLNKRSSTPNVYLFLQQSGDGPDSNLQNLINDIADETSSCFDRQKRPVQMGRADFAAPNGDYGYAIEQYKKKIQKGNVLLIVNLNEIPAHAARALHTICDTYSPIADNVVIFLTLNASNSTAGTAVQIATDTLYDLWGQQLRDNELDPLITRVTDQVLLLKS